MYIDEKPSKRKFNAAVIAHIKERVSSDKEVTLESDITKDGLNIDKLDREDIKSELEEEFDCEFKIERKSMTGLDDDDMTASTVKEFSDILYTSIEMNNNDFYDILSIIRSMEAYQRVNELREFFESNDGDCATEALVGSKESFLAFEKSIVSFEGLLDKFKKHFKLIISKISISYFEKSLQKAKEKLEDGKVYEASGIGGDHAGRFELRLAMKIYDIPSPYTNSDGNDYVEELMKYRERVYKNPTPKLLFDKHSFNEIVRFASESAKFFKDRCDAIKQDAKKATESNNTVLCYKLTMYSRELVKAYVACQSMVRSVLKAVLGSQKAAYTAMEEDNESVYF